jgi:FtsZ-interacting cell division protein ZipA
MEEEVQEEEEEEEEQEQEEEEEEEQEEQEQEEWTSTKALHSFLNRKYALINIHPTAGAALQSPPLLESYTFSGF